MDKKCTTYTRNCLFSKNKADDLTTIMHIIQLSSLVFLLWRYFQDLPELEDLGSSWLGLLFAAIPSTLAAVICGYNIARITLECCCPRKKAADQKTKGESAADLISNFLGLVENVLVIIPSYLSMVFPEMNPSWIWNRPGFPDMVRRLCFSLASMFGVVSALSQLVKKSVMTSSACMRCCKISRQENEGESQRSTIHPNKLVDTIANSVATVFETAIFLTSLVASIGLSVGLLAPAFCFPMLTMSAIGFSAKLGVFTLEKIIDKCFEAAKQCSTNSAENSTNSAKDYQQLS